MSKEYLEALNVIKNIKLSHVEGVFDTVEVDDGSIGCIYPDQTSIIEEALQRLKSIDNSNPGEAMKELNEIIEYITEDKKVKYKATILFDCEIIKDALLKTQEQEKALDDNLIFENGHIMSGFSYKGKDIVAMPLNEYAELMDQQRVLEIISEKQVDIEYLNKCNDVKEYNAHWCDERFYLTQEEFDLLKSWLDNKKKE